MELDSSPRALAVPVQQRKAVDQQSHAPRILCLNLLVHVAARPPSRIFSAEDPFQAPCEFKRSAQSGWFSLPPTQPSASHCRTARFFNWMPW